MKPLARGHSHACAGLREAHLLPAASMHCWPDAAEVTPMDSLSQPSPNAHAHSSVHEAALLRAGLPDVDPQLLPAPAAVEAVLDLTLSSLPGQPTGISAWS